MSVLEVNNKADSREVAKFAHSIEVIVVHNMWCCRYLLKTHSHRWYIDASQISRLTTPSHPFSPHGADNDARHPIIPCTAEYSVGTRLSAELGGRRHCYDCSGVGALAEL